MKKAVMILVVVAFALSLVSVAFAAAKTMSGTIKEVNISAGTITFCPTNSKKDETFKVAHALNIKTMKPGKAEVTVSNGTVTSVKPLAAPKAPRRMIEGC